MASYNNSGKNKIPWWLVIGSFCIGLWPLGIVLLILRLTQESNTSSRSQGEDPFEAAARRAERYANEVKDGFSDAARSIRSEARTFRENRGADKVRQAEKAKWTEQMRRSQNPQQANAQSAQTAQPQNPKPQSAQSAPVKKSGSKLAERLRKLKTGKWPTIIGGAIMGVFGFATVMTLVENISYMSYEPFWLLEEVLPLFIFTGIGAGIFTFGRIRNRQSKKFRRYLSLIGDQQQISIPALAAAYPASVSSALNTVEAMISDGLLGDAAYIDYGRKMLILDGSGVREEEPVRERVAPETDVGVENAWLRQIREVNDAIQHPELSRKIDRIEEITQRILEFQKEHPDKAPELRRFLNYYLPTTLKILSSYAELERQGVEGENIAATKKRIEGMMDMVVEGFERQLDKLFAGDMMDIASDITVMEQMMRGDGLFQDDDHQIGGH